jgi:hypothetical protein
MLNFVMFGWGRFLEFFLRVALKFTRRIGTGGWPVTRAIVVSSIEEDGFWGCDRAVIRYKYRNTDMRFEGTHKQPFVFRNYAEAYLRRYPGGSEFPVRVNPKNPSYSIPAEGRIVFTRVE